MPGRVVRIVSDLLVPVALLVGFTNGCHRDHGHAAQARAADAAQPDAGPAAPFAKFDATLHDVGLTRDLGDGAAALHTTACTDDTMTVTTPTGPVRIKFGGCMRCELNPSSPQVLADVDAARIEGYAHALRDQPPGFLSKAGVTRVALCWRLVSESRGDAGAGAFEGQLIGGTVDHGRGEILLSLEPMEGLTGQEIVHHELFHVIEITSDLEHSYRDPAWLALNPPGFAYLHRDADAASPGFLSAHAMSNLREDQATVYQYAMARPDELCAAGPIVLGKARLIRDRIAAVLGDAHVLEQRAPCLTKPAAGAAPSVPHRAATFPRHHAPVRRRPPPRRVPKPACSQQTAIDATMFECSFGALGKVVGGGSSVSGWALLDTGATDTLVRTLAKGDAEAALSSAITIGAGFTFESAFATANRLWSFRAPTDAQVATIGTDLMKLWSVRFSTADRKVYFSDDQHACSAEALAAAGFHRLDTAGYYQREGKHVNVGKWAAPTVPTVEVSVLGQRVRAQLDTGYEGAERQLQVNKAFYAVLQAKAKLGPKTTRTVGGFKSAAFETPEGDFALVDSDTHEPFGLHRPMVIVVKEGDGGIAGWSVPAAQISSLLFFEIADAAELRADQHAMWVHAREAPPDPASICR